jgi:hypothetical protein
METTMRKLIAFLIGVAAIIEAPASSFGQMMVVGCAGGVCGGGGDLNSMQEAALQSAVAPYVASVP